MQPPCRRTCWETHTEVKLFAKLTGRRDHIRSVVTVALNTGMRRGEILDLQWEHVNFIARTIFIAKSKTGRTRTIPMNDIVFKELMMLKQDAGTRDFVFSVSKTGVNIDSIKTGWRHACEDAGLVNLRFHDTRHTFATRLRANGVHEWDIRDLVGHTSVRMTSVYTHQTPANLCHAVNTLTNTKLGRVVRFPRKKRERSTKQIAPSSRHRGVEQLLAQQHEDVSVRELAS